MAKYALALALILVSGHINAQVVFHGYLRSSCSTAINKLTDFRIGKNGIWYLSCAGSNTVSLPDTGIYTLQSSRLSADGESLLIRIDNAIVTDTFKQADMITPAFAGCWLYCGRKCNGYEADFYANGQKRVEGWFKKGVPIGQLTYYRLDGTVNYVENYDRKGNRVNGGQSQVVAGGAASL